MPDRLQPDAFSDSRVHRQRSQNLEFQEISGLVGQADTGKFFCRCILGRHDVLRGLVAVTAEALLYESLANEGTNGLLRTRSSSEN